MWLNSVGAGYEGGLSVFRGKRDLRLLRKPSVCLKLPQLPTQAWVH